MYSENSRLADLVRLALRGQGSSPSFEIRVIKTDSQRERLIIYYQGRKVMNCYYNPIALVLLWAGPEEGFSNYQRIEADSTLEVAQQFYPILIFSLNFLKTLNHEQPSQKK